MVIFSSLADAVLDRADAKHDYCRAWNTSLGGLAGIVSQLEQGGLASQVQSWLGPGTNFPITADQLRFALSDQHVQEIAQQLGLPVDAAMQILAQHLPAAVDKASPSGTIQP